MKLRIKNPYNNIVREYKSRTTINNVNPKFKNLLIFYVDYRDNVINSNSELYKLKKEYDQHPTRQ